MGGVAASFTYGNRNGGRHRAVGRMPRPQRPAAEPAIPAELLDTVVAAMQDLRRVAGEVERLLASVPTPTTAPSHRSTAGRHRQPASLPYAAGLMTGFTLLALSTLAALLGYAWSFA